MNARKQKSLFVTLIILLPLLLASLVIIYKQYKKIEALTDTVVSNIENEWYLVNRMTHYVDYYVNEYDVPHPEGIERCSLFVNQVCHNFNGGSTSELTSVMRNWLTLSYSYIFADLSKSEPIDVDVALQIVRDMNTTLASICGRVLEMDGAEKKSLLDWESPEYESLLTIAKEASQKYSDATNDYYRALANK